MRTDDPIRDFERYDRERAREEKRLPKCSWCEKRITDEMCYEIDGDIICEACISLCHQFTDNYIDE